VTDDELLLALARLLTRAEDRTRTNIRPTLLELILRIRALLLATLTPASPLLYAPLYIGLRPQILTLLQQLTTTYSNLLRGSFPDLHAALRLVHAARFNLPPDTLPPQPTATLLDNTIVLTRPTSALLTPTPTGISPLTLQLERLLDTTVRAAILRADPLDTIANLITPSRTITKGTAANALLERLAAITAATFWSLSTNTQQAAASAAGYTGPWRWNAILDPKTCPICRPLHNTLAATPEQFPSGPPPVHPLCRCIILPV
jgi:hypothetical protein